MNFMQILINISRYNAYKLKSKEEIFSKFSDTYSWISMPKRRPPLKANTFTVDSRRNEKLNDLRNRLHRYKVTQYPSH